MRARMSAWPGIAFEDLLVNRFSFVEAFEREVDDPEI